MQDYTKDRILISEGGKKLKNINLNVPFILIVPNRPTDKGSNNNQNLTY